LNGYPGPRHTLELAKELGLSDAQQRRIEELFAKMKAESIPIGEHLIAQETELDSLFAHRTITPAELAAQTQAIGATQGALRATHLKYHLLTLDALTPAQVQRYAELRGYAAGNQHNPAEHATHH
jgi:Spy/CpxP family protein refolding chaperone